ncbi:MAG: glycosyltransferase family 2 protein [bacterium]
MSISIVTVTYNSSNNIINFLDSIKKSKYHKNLEIILIDNNSNDRNKLKKKILEFQKTCNLKIIAKYKDSNDGFGVSCNDGSYIAKYEEILFLNPDTTLEYNSLNILESHLLKNDAGICGGKSCQVNNKAIHRTVFNVPTIFSMLFEFSNLGKIFGINSNFYVNQSDVSTDISVDGVGGAYLLIKKELFEKINGFDPNIFMYLEDVDLCLRAGKLGIKIIYCPHSKINHIGGASSNNKYRIAHDAWYESREYYSKKHFSKIISLILVLIFKVERIILQIREKIINK